MIDAYPGLAESESSLTETLVRSGISESKSRHSPYTSLHE